MNKNLQIRNVCWIILIGLTFSFCYEPTDGCLDPFASNYDVTADDDCEDCCTNPPLALTLRLRVDSLNFSKNIAYGYVPGDTIVVTELEFNLSQFSLTDSIDDPLFSYKMEDSLTTDQLSIVNDILFVNASAKSYTPGRFRYVGEVSNFDFSIGIPQQINNNTVIFEDNDFTQMRDSLYDENEGIYSKLNFSYFLITDSIVERVQLLSTQVPKDFLSFSLDTFSQKATALSLSVNFDLAALWKDVDFTSDPIEAIEEKFDSNFYKSFTID